MRMRYGMGAVIALLVVALAVCAGLSRKSKRSMAPSVAKLIGALVMPVTGNLIIILSSDRTVRPSTGSCVMESSWPLWEFSSGK